MELTGIVFETVGGETHRYCFGEFTWNFGITYGCETTVTVNIK
jgi:hypothetical protein